MRARIEPGLSREDEFALDDAAGYAFLTTTERDRRRDLARNFTARDADGRAVGMAQVFLMGDVAFVAGMLVTPGERARGVGGALLDACLALCDAEGVRRIELFATDDGLRLYERAGFGTVGWSTRWRREAPAQPARGEAGVHAMHPVSLSEAIEVGEADARAVGYRRTPYLMAYLQAAPWAAQMTRDRRTGDASGFVFASERHVGPLVADDAEAAGALLDASQRLGAPPQALAHDENPGVAPLLRASGFAPSEMRVRRMARGGAAAPDDARVWLWGSWAHG